MTKYVAVSDRAKRILGEDPVELTIATKLSRPTKLGNTKFTKPVYVTHPVICWFCLENDIKEVE